ncbi:hypothetical protein Q7P37_001530 [Cladosporium fusiforme]
MSGHHRSPAHFAHSRTFSHDIVSSFDMEDYRLPPDYSSPFATVTADDHSAWIIIAALLGLVYSILFGLVRAFVSVTTGGGKVHGDDVALTVSTAFAVAQSSVVLGACSHGLGKTWAKIPLVSHTKVQKMYYASFLLFILALGLSKMSVVLFQARLTATRWQKQVFKGLTVLIAIWMAVSILVLALQCDLSSPWKVLGQECPGSGPRWLAISVFDILIEVAITTLACQLVWSLQMTKVRKWSVISAFAYRLVLIIPITFRLATHDPTGMTRDPTFRSVLFVVWTQVELHLTVITATIPVLRPVINNLNTSYSSLGPSGSSADYGTSQGTYKLSNLKKPSSRKAGSEATPCGSDVRGAQTLNTALVATSFAQDVNVKHGTAQDTSSIESHGSEQMIIRKQMSWRVEHDSSG